MYVCDCERLQSPQTRTVPTVYCGVRGTKLPNIPNICEVIVYPLYINRTNKARNELNTFAGRITINRCATPISTQHSSAHHNRTTLIKR